MALNAYPGKRVSFKWFIVPVVVVVGIAATVIGLSMYFFRSSPPPYNYDSPYYGGFGWPFFGFGWIFIPLVFILIFFGFRWFFWGGCTWGRGWGYYRQHYDPALQTLRERYARGDINKEQFDDMSRKLHEIRNEQ